MILTIKYLMFWQVFAIFILLQLAKTNNAIPIPNDKIVSFSANHLLKFEKRDDGDLSILQRSLSDRLQGGMIQPKRRILKERESGTDFTCTIPGGCAHEYIHKCPGCGGSRLRRRFVKFTKRSIHVIQKSKGSLNGLKLAFNFNKGAKHSDLNTLQRSLSDRSQGGMIQANKRVLKESGSGTVSTRTNSGVCPYTPSPNCLGCGRNRLRRRLLSVVKRSKDLMQKTKRLLTNSNPLLNKFDRRENRCPPEKDPNDCAHSYSANCPGCDLRRFLFIKRTIGITQNVKRDLNE